MSINSNLMENFKDKEFRHAYVAARIKKDLPFQIRALRKKMGWSQHDLAIKTGMKQSRISLLENPDYDKGFRTETLLRIAEAFDVALMVRLAPFSELANWVDNLSEATFAVPSFEEDQESTAATEIIAWHTSGEIESYSLVTMEVGGNIDANYAQALDIAA